MARAIDADADRDRAASPPSPSIRMPANFLPVEQQIVRPFDRKLRLQPGGELGDRVVDRERRDERQFRPMLGRRRVGEQQAREEIAGLRHPGAAAPAAARALALGGDPQRARARPRAPSASASALVEAEHVRAQ